MFLKANAKINLSLDVLRRREDGYHEVRMIMQMVGMYDRIVLHAESGKPGIRLETNLSYIPKDEHNLAVKAAKLLMDEYEVNDGLSIRLEKFIPVAAGLAGGSTDAAMVLTGVNRLFHLGASPEKLMETGARIGADVPYCIMGGTALSEGIGEILTPLPPMPDAWILLCKPNVNVSTKEIYGGLVLDEETRHPDVDRMIRAIKERDLKEMANPACMSNVLETVTGRRYAVIGQIEQTMRDFGALSAIMSGSGPTVFGIFEEKENGEAARAALKRMLPSARIFLTWPENGGNHTYYG